MGTMSLPPGFRFHPTDEELVGYYLNRKVNKREIELEVIPVVDLYKFEPWELPEKSFLPKRDLEWYFFCPRDRKYPNGSRTNRATTTGYWKATGKDRRISCHDGAAVYGLRKTLVFYRGRAPGGERTDWVMHEYRICQDLLHGANNFIGAYALCRVIKRHEAGLQGGAEPAARAKLGQMSKVSSSSSLVTTDHSQLSRGGAAPFTPTESASPPPHLDFTSGGDAFRAPAQSSVPYGDGGGMRPPLWFPTCTPQDAFFAFGNFPGSDDASHSPFFGDDMGGMNMIVSEHELKWDTGLTTFPAAGAEVWNPASSASAAGPLLCRQTSCEQGVDDLAAAWFSSDDINKVVY